MKNTFTFNFNDISKYRTQLMGVSILVIMFFHCGLIPYGHIGVEFFLCISAIGLFYSLKKNPDTVQFYKRRLVRILPTYFFLMIPYLFIYSYYHEDESFGDLCAILFQIRTLTETMNWSQWFISLILICYGITPFFFKHSKYLLSLWFLIPFTIFIFSFQEYVTPSYLLARIPVFLISLKFASSVYEKKVIHLGTLIALIFGTVLFIFFSNKFFSEKLPDFNFIGLVFLLLTVPLISLITKCIAYLPNIFLSILSFFGKISLELYLCHEVLKYAISKIYFQGQEDWSITNILIISALSFIVAIPTAYLAHLVVDVTMKVIKK